MTSVPSEYTELDLIGFTDKGSYAEGITYVENDLVHYKGSIYRCLVDDTVDVLPDNTSVWTIFVPGSSNLESITAVDTEGKLGTKGEEVSAQRLVDELARLSTSSTEDMKELEKKLTNMISEKISNLKYDLADGKLDFNIAAEDGKYITTEDGIGIIAEIQI